MTFNPDCIKHTPGDRATRALCAIALSIVIGGAHAQDFPARKAGLWEIAIENDGGPARTAKHCVDAKTDQQMQQIGQGMGTQCQRTPIRRDGNAYLSSSECKFGERSVSSKSTITGDFQSNLRSEVVSVFNPPRNGKANSKTVVNAKWVGPCPAGMVPGDMEMSGAGRMNINSMMQGANKAGQTAKPQ